MFTTTLFNIPISITSLDGALATITNWVTEGQRPKAKGQRTKGRNGFSSALGPRPSALSPRIVVTPNPEMIVAAQKDPVFMNALQSADLSIADGWGLVAAVRLLQRTSGKGEAESGKGSKEFNPPSRFTLHASRLQRISGISLMEHLVVLAARNGWRVMLLGGKPGVAERAAEKLRSGKRKAESGKCESLYPLPFTLHALSGPPDISYASRHELDSLITSINKVKPDLLFVAFGHGKQEQWLTAHRKQLNVGVAMGVGGAFDQIVDPTLRPPAIINCIGLGWLYRLIREPWRWRRQLALVEFAGMVVRARWKTKHGT